MLFYLSRLNALWQLRLLLWVSLIAVLQFRYERIARPQCAVSFTIKKRILHVTLPLILTLVRVWDRADQFLNGFVPGKRTDKLPCGRDVMELFGIRGLSSSTNIDS